MFQWVPDDIDKLERHEKVSLVVAAIIAIFAASVFLWGLVTFIGR